MLRHLCHEAIIEGLEKTTLSHTFVFSKVWFIRVREKNSKFKGISPFFEQETLKTLALTMQLYA